MEATHISCCQSRQPGWGCAADWLTESFTAAAFGTCVAREVNQETPARPTDSLSILFAPCLGVLSHYFLVCKLGAAWKPQSARDASAVWQVAVLICRIIQKSNSPFIRRCVCASAPLSLQIFSPAPPQLGDRERDRSLSVGLWQLLLSK